MDIIDLPFACRGTAAAASAHASAALPTPSVLVRELSDADGDRLKQHFLTLAAEDRLLRFGHMVSDRVVENYVAALDFEQDAVFGVYDDQLHLLGVGHLAYLRPYAGKRGAELGVSVLAQARGQGIGTHLFARAAIRCRNQHIDSLYMHCLSRNGTMMHIAKKAGMAINHAYGEADAYLTLAPADPQSVSFEQYQDRIAASDYAVKQRARQLRLAPTSKAAARITQ